MTDDRSEDSRLIARADEWLDAARWQSPSRDLIMEFRTRLEAVTAENKALCAAIRKYLDTPFEKIWRATEELERALSAERGEQEGEGDELS